MKKVYYLLVILLILPVAYCGKKNPVSGDSGISSTASSVRYVNARSGLRMRDKADADGAVVVTIPVGEKIETFEVTGNDITISGVTGKWTRISWNGKTGWAFGGFLSDKPVTSASVKLPDGILGGYFETAEPEPGNMPSRVTIEPGMITKAIGGYVNSSSYCVIGSFETNGNVYTVKCSERDLTAEEFKTFSIDTGATKLKSVVITDNGSGLILVDRIPFTKRKSGGPL